MRADAHAIDYKSHDRPTRVSQTHPYVCKQSLDLLNEVYNFAVTDPF